jgi:hypothetical protein
MAIDLKYGHIPVAGVGDDEPVFVVRAQDVLSPRLLRIYRELCAVAGSPPRHLDGIGESVTAFESWQAGHHTQTPQSAP